MKVFSKITLGVLVSSLLVFATGCGEQGLPSGMSPEDVITQALLNQEETIESVFEFQVDADLKGEVDGEQNNLKGKFVISGTSNKDNLSFQVSLDADAEMNEEKFAANIEIRSNKDGAFVKITEADVSDPQTKAMIEAMLEEPGYLGEWVKVDFMQPEDLAEAGYFDVDYVEGDPLPFKNIEYVGMVDILGVNSYHFTAEVDEDLILELAQGTASDAEEFFEKADIKGDVYVAVDKMVLTGFGGTMTLAEEEMNGTVTMSFKLNPTTSKSVSTPDYEKEFTEEDLAALMFGGAMMPTGDLEGMEDLSEEELAELFGELEELEDYDDTDDLGVEDLPEGYKDFDFPEAGTMPGPEDTSADNPMLTN